MHPDDGHLKAQRRDARGRYRRKARRDGGAERHAVQHGRVDVEVVEQLLQLLAQHLERERRLRPVGEAAAILVVRDDAKVLREKWRLVRNVRERPQRAAVDDHEHGVALFAEVAVRGGAGREVSNLVLGGFAERRRCDALAREELVR